MTRGQRNNNPCNIRKTTDKWIGQVSNLNGKTDKAFCQFDTMKHGLRATFKLLFNYRKKYNINCIWHIVHKWAPEKDGNNERAYVAFIESRTGLDKWLPLVTEEYKAVVSAMCEIESQYKPSPEEIDEAYELALRH